MPDKGPVDAAIKGDAKVVEDGSETPDTHRVDAGLSDNAINDVAAYAVEPIDVKRAQTMISSGKYALIDVREPSELSALGFIAGATNMPWNSGALSRDYAKIAKKSGVIVYCQSGMRSSVASKFLVSKGLKPVYDVLGGFRAWARAGLPIKKN